MKVLRSSLDRQAACMAEQRLLERQGDLERWPGEDFLIGRGAGLSYVAASFDETAVSLDVSVFDRLLDFNAQEGWIEAEAGITLGQLFRFLAPRGWQLAVQPGYPGITLGGCIAGDVHGKNHLREGTFKRHVLGFELLHPDHGRLWCSPDENAEVFDLTLGGLGLTGLILRARIKLAPLKGAWVEERHWPVDSLEEAFAQALKLKDRHDMLYAWLDLAEAKKAAGKGYIATADLIPGPLPQEMHAPPACLDPSGSNLKRRPLFNRFTMPWINRLYRWQGLRHGGAVRIGLPVFLFPAAGKESYFHFYGDRGFVELQMLLPFEAADSYLPAFRSLLSRHDVPVILATLKIFEGGSQTALRYDGEGYSFTIDVAATPRALAMLAELDGLNTEHGVVTGVLKDSRLSSSVAQAQYRGYDEFKARLRTFDPRRRFRSTLSERLGL
ncbi:MAG: FAD-binding oxidoreductase [Alphaproteobacteria bacterium]|nr:FAD-binding oxidoreductase [Alphaproteobacteria bacterium]